MENEEERMNEKWFWKTEGLKEGVIERIDERKLEKDRTKEEWLRKEDGMNEWKKNEWEK